MTARSVTAAFWLAFLTGCGLFGGSPIEEAAELAMMGNQRPLQDPMTPIRGGTRLLVFALDGVGHDDLISAIAEGRMPALAAVLGEGGEGGMYERGYSVPGVLSVLPSATTVAWASTFTGATPANTGVPGNEWFDREAMEFHALVPVSVSNREDALKLYTDELMSQLLRARTVYEQLGLRIYVSLHPVYRGADLLTIPNVGSFGDLFEEIVTGVVQGGAGSDPGVFAEIDVGSVPRLEAAIDEYGLPDLQTVYFPGIDLTTHESENPLASQQAYLTAVTDSAIGQVIDIYRRHGALDDTYVMVIADHGHTPVLHDDAHSLTDESGDEAAELLGQLGFRVRPLELSTGEEDYQAALAYQGAMAYVYLADRSTCPAVDEVCDWRQPPRLDEDLITAARAFHEANESGARVPGLLGALDLILVRPPTPAGTPAADYQVFDGQALVPIGGYLDANPRPDLLDFERRIGWLSDGPHARNAGDIILTTSWGMDTPIDQRFYFSKPYWSEHGSASAQDSRIPLLVAHTGRSGDALRELISSAIGDSPTQLDIAPLMRALLAQ
jgi:hypothetical protein